MKLFLLPWLEIAILLSLLGSIAVSRIREPGLAGRWGMSLTGLVFAATFAVFLVPTGYGFGSLAGRLAVKR
jgi:hypothetical protein